MTSPADLALSAFLRRVNEQFEKEFMGEQHGEPGDVRVRQDKLSLSALEDEQPSPLSRGSSLDGVAPVLTRPCSECSGTGYRTAPERHGGEYQQRTPCDARGCRGGEAEWEIWDADD